MNDVDVDVRLSKCMQSLCSCNYHQDLVQNRYLDDVDVVNTVTWPVTVTGIAQIVSNGFQ